MIKAGCLSENARPLPPLESQLPLPTPLFNCQLAYSPPSIFFSTPLSKIPMSPHSDSPQHNKAKHSLPPMADPTTSFSALSDEILFSLLDSLSDSPSDVKSFSLVCKSFFDLESRHRLTLRPYRLDLLPSILTHRYRHVHHLDLTLCPLLSDISLSVVATACRSSLLSIDLSRSRLFTHVGLADLVSNCPSLVEIDLSNASEMTDVGAAAISRARNLERLRLVRCKKVTDLGIGCIAVGCPKLRMICLRWCLGVTDLGVGLIAVKCREIRSLDLSYLQITKKCLPSILQLQYLEDLILKGCLGIDDESLTTLQHGGRTLQDICFELCVQVFRCLPFSLASLRETMLQRSLRWGILESMPCQNLKQMIITSLAESLQKLPKLQSLILDGCNLVHSKVKAISDGCISLTELSLSKCEGVTDEDLSHLAMKHKKLMKLDITCCRKITHLSISSIMTSCTCLTSLKMESCSLVSEEAFVLIGQYCCMLEELDLTDSKVDNEDEGLIQIGLSCPRIKELDLYRSVGISDMGVQQIAHGCPNMRKINLSYCKDITDDSLRSLSKCLRLMTLEIRGCTQISSAGLAAIGMGCKQITQLDLKFCHNIDDAGILQLAHQSQNLRQVAFSFFLLPFV
ncbi:hypothetical protein ACLOJK_023120 [Asimina triloba]